MAHIARTEVDVNRAKLMIDTDKWLASKLIPKVYGDKIEVTVDAKPSILQALQEADARVALRLRCDPERVIDGEFETVSGVAGDGSVDDESVALPIVPDIFS